ncbi:MAG: biotin--[Alloprevotella sp.]|nr:biotin--[acetyl-CoA-carboxylase] ligase [Alloprevotella sp.]
MNIEQAREYCLAKRGAGESFPFDGETLVFKVCGKIFAVLALERPDRIVLKCHPDRTDVLRAAYGAVQAAHHFHKATWNQILFDADADDGLILALIDHAYGETLRGLPKKQQIAFFHDGLPPHIAHTHKNTCNSTMDDVRNCPPLSAGTSLSLLTTDLQHAGRGQRGNHWESENGRNLLFSFTFVPPAAVKPAAQFLLSEVVSLALVDTLSPLLAELPREEQPCVKWPNDIYVGDRKLAGMLLQHTTLGDRIAETTVGIGLNVNQDVFRSDAPNPTSLRLLLGYELPRYLLLEQFLAHFDARLAALSSPDALHADYLRHLYRREGLHPFRDADGSFLASIAAVLPDGRLVLRRPDGTEHPYAFKEVEHET